MQLSKTGSYIIGDIFKKQAGNKSTSQSPFNPSASEPKHLGFCFLRWNQQRLRGKSFSVVSVGDQKIETW
jgi:hypothetical protein